MTPGRISLACAVLLSAVYLSTGQSGIPIDDNIEDAVWLSSTRQVVTFVSALTKIGDNLTTIVVNFNRSVVSEIVHATYSLYGSGRVYVSVDHKGVVTLKKRPTVTTFYVGFSVLVTVKAVGKNGTFPVFLSGQLVLRNVGIVRFNDTSISTSIRAFLPIGTNIYNLTKNVEMESAYIRSFSLSYSGYSSYFYFQYNGIVTLRRELSPSTYSARPRLNYRITFTNGSLLSSYEYISFRVAVIGCRLSEEGSVEWPTMGACQRAEHTCTKYHPQFMGGMVARHCDSTGKSSVPDFSRCCVQPGSGPFALVWFTYSGVSSTTYLSSVETIKRSVSSLFRSRATSVNLYSAYRSNRYYGFTMSFTVNLTSGVTISTVQTALRLLNSYRRFGVSYLRYERESRGIRAFMPSSCCQPYNYTIDVTSSLAVIRMPFCCGTTAAPCTCTASSNCNPSAYNAGRCRTCSNPSLNKSPDAMCPEETTPVPTAAPIPHNRTCIRFDESSYTGKLYIGSSARGARVLTVGTVACDSTLIKNYTAHYALNGYLSDYFDIGKLTGVITTSGLPLSVRLYSFYVSAFIDITYKNGTRIQNFTETNVRVDVNGGISFNQTLYRVTAPIDAAVNTSSIIDLGAEIVVDPTYVKKYLSLTFTSISNSLNFGITKEGHVYPRAPLTANVNYYAIAYYTYTIIDMSNKRVTYRGTVRMYIRAQGCLQEEGGSYVWPRTHSCGIVEVACSHFDSSFDDYGQVRRQCTKDGVWLTPDFSQCRMKAGSPPFVLLWFTFSSVYTRHWNELYTPRTLSELRSYMSGFPVTGITVHHNKESKVLYGFVQSFKAELRPGSTLNGTLLQTLKDTITTARRIGGRTKSTQPYTAGVVGITTSDRCMQFIATNVTDYTPVCVLSDTASCLCKQNAPRVNSMCCTDEGQVNKTLDMCKPPGKRIVVPVVRLPTITMTLKRSGQSMLVSWTLSSGDTPDSFEVVYRSKDHEQRLMVNNTQSSVNVTGLLPGTSYTVSVRGYYNSGQSISSLQAIWIEDKTIFKFQILLSGVTSCPQLKANMDDLRKHVANTVSAGCRCSFSLDRLALTVDECPYGKTSDNMAMMRGWIYDTGDSPDQKYFPYMQKMASKDVSITAGDMKLSAARVCASSCSNNFVPATSPVIAAGGSTTAGTVVGIIIGIVGCVLLAVILIIIILRFKNGKSQPAPTPGKLPGSAVGVTLSETTKGMEDDDDAELQKDF